MSDPRIKFACCACPIADTCGLVCSARDERKALYDKLVAQTYAAGKALKYAEMFEGATERRLFANGFVRVDLCFCVAQWTM